MKSLFRCPVCGGPLDREERVYRCADRHSYDIAKEGYTYLLPPNQKHSADPGDDKAMSAARRDFLSKKYYAPLLNTLCSRILPLVGEHPVILDAGCGEGYYTAGIRAALTAAGKTPAIAGIDISKSILRLAAKREKQVEFAVASCYHLPFADETADLLLDCFSPLAIDEFRRVRRLSQAQIGAISAPICAFYRRSLGGFSVVSVQPCPLFSDSGSKLGQAQSSRIPLTSRVELIYIERGSPGRKLFGLFSYSPKLRLSCSQVLWYNLNTKIEQQIGI